jgi:mannosyltransferase
LCIHFFFSVQNIKMHRKSLLLILTLALLLRLAVISTRPLWYDEAFSALFASSGPRAMLAGTLTSQDGVAADVHPLMYYTMLWGWMKVWGSSPWAVRGFSVLMGLGVVLLTYLLGRNIFDEKFGLLSAALIACSPFQIHYAQEARMYELMALFLLLATYGLWRGITTRRWGWWLLFTVCSALAQYTHNLSLFFLVPLAFSILLSGNKWAVRVVIMSSFGALLLYFPWLLRLPTQFAKVQTAYWTPRPSPARLLTTLLSFVTNLPLPGIWLVVGLFVTVLITTLGAWQTLRAWRANPKGVRRALWMLYLSLAPAVLLFLVSQWVPLFIERALLPAGVFFIIWLTWVLFRSEFPRPVQNISLAILLLGFVLGYAVHLTYSGFPYAPFSQMTASLSERSEPGDVILHSNKLTYLPMHYYAPDMAQFFIGDPPGSGEDTLAPATQAVLGIQASPDLDQAVGDAPRVWFVIFEQAITEYQDVGETTHPHLNWLAAQYDQHQVEQWGESFLYVYTNE